MVVTLRYATDVMNVALGVLEMESVGNPCTLSRLILATFFSTVDGGITLQLMNQIFLYFKGFVVVSSCWSWGCVFTRWDHTWV